MVVRISKHTTGNIKVYKINKSNGGLKKSPKPKITPISLIDHSNFIKIDKPKPPVKTRNGEIIFNNSYKKIKEKILPEINTMNKKIVVYTCIVGNYDKLNEIKYQEENVDYVCFTDQPFTSHIWQIRPIPEELNNLTHIKRQRYIKVNAHVFFKEYDFSVWVDGRVNIIGSIKNVINSLLFDKYKIHLPIHPDRICIYKEADICKKLNKDNYKTIDEQILKYKQEKYPEKYGLVQTGILVREHNNVICKNLMERWWGEIEQHSHRDQLSFNYTSWKLGIDFNYLDKNLFHSNTFSIGTHTNISNVVKQDVKLTYKNFYN